jgi:cytochrome b subunit of formate dehydrogenase
MSDDKNPVFRKAIIPWYRGTKAYIFVITFMLLVFLFALTGIAVAREYHSYQGYVWVPAVLLVLSAAIIITMTVRLIKRYSHKSAK